MGALARSASVQKCLEYAANVELPFWVAIKLAHAALALAEAMAACLSRSAKPAKLWGKEDYTARQAMNHSQDLTGRVAHKVVKETDRSGSGARQI